MILQHNGIEPLPVPVDGDGLDVTALAGSDARAVLTTPAHQSPTGVVLSAARRTALVEWARQGGLVIEDDYDAEYRYDRAPVGSVQGIAPDRVVYICSASKTLAPGLRLGWMVVPQSLIGAVRLAKGFAETGSSVMDQIAFAALVTSGGYDRHLRHMRRRYLTRRRRPPHRPVSRRLPDRRPGSPRGGHAGERRAVGILLRRPGEGTTGTTAGLCQPHRVGHRCGDLGAGAGGTVTRRDNVGMATVDVEVHTTIGRPRAEVAAYSCDPDNATAWYANIKAVTWETAKPLALGSRFRFVSGFLGRTLEYTYEVVEMIPAQRFVMRSDRGPFPMETTYTWADAGDGGTWMTIRNRGEPTAFAGLASPIVATAIRRATAKDLARLKALLEGR
jgi:Polyketide cyclase / dehydrase and lipid transport/Aminotransferase class I and II